MALKQNFYCLCTCIDTEYSCQFDANFAVNNSKPAAFPSYGPQVTARDVSGGPTKKHCAHIEKREKCEYQNPKDTQNPKPGREKNAELSFLHLFRSIF